MVQSFSSVYCFSCIFTTLWRRYSQVWGRLCWINSIMLIYSKINKDRICFASESTLLLMFQSLRMILHKIQSSSTFLLSFSSALFFFVFLHWGLSLSVSFFVDIDFLGRDYVDGYKFLSNDDDDKKNPREMKYRQWRRIQIRRDHPSSSSKPGVM